MNPDGVYLGNYRGSLIGDQTVLFSNTSMSASLTVLHIHMYCMSLVILPSIFPLVNPTVTAYRQVGPILAFFSLHPYVCILSLTNSYVCIMSSKSSLHPFYLYPFFTISLLFVSFLHYVPVICILSFLHPFLSSLYLYYVNPISTTSSLLLFLFLLKPYSWVQWILSYNWVQ